MRIVDVVNVRYAERPGATACMGDGSDVRAAKHAGGKDCVVEHTALTSLLECHEALPGGVRERGELAPAPDPDIAFVVGPARMKERDVRRNGRNHQNRIIRHGKGVL